VWLKKFAIELEEERYGMFLYSSRIIAYIRSTAGGKRIGEDIVDRLLFARLELDPQSMS